MSAETRNVDLVGDEVVVNIARAALLAALTGAFAYVSFPNPVSPVPVTLQVLGVFLAGVFLGPVWGTVSMVFYVAAGAVGAPIYSGGGAGLGSLLGPYGGYLWSYPVAAGVTGLAVHGLDGLVDPADSALPRLVGAMVLGTVVIYTFGTVGYAVVNGIGLYEAFLVAAVAFIPAEAFKMAATVGIARSDSVAAS